MNVHAPLERFRTPAVLGLLILFGAIAAAVSASAQQPRPRKAHPSFVMIEDQPGLPRVLLIGDSISMQYTLPVREALDGVANVHRPARNCRSTRQTLAELDEYLGSKPWDVIHFNWGIHDVTHLGQDGKVAAPPSGTLQVPLEEYEKNVRELVQRLKKTGATLVWATTTPIGSQTETKGYRRDRDVVDYNEKAAKIMQQEGVVVDDLYSVVKPRAEELLSDGVHFNERGVSVLTEQVSCALRSALETPANDGAQSERNATELQRTSGKTTP